MKGKFGVVAQLDLRPDGAPSRGSAAPSVSLKAVHSGSLGSSSASMSCSRERLEHGALVEVLAGVVEDRIAAAGHAALDAERPLEHGPRRLAGPEPGHARAAREVAHGFVDGLDDLVGRKLNVEHDAAAVGRTWK